MNIALSLDIYIALGLVVWSVYSLMDSMKKHVSYSKPDSKSG